MRQWRNGPAIIGITTLLTAVAVCAGIMPGSHLAESPITGTPTTTTVRAVSQPSNPYLRYLPRLADLSGATTLTVFSAQTDHRTVSSDGGGCDVRPELGQPDARGVYADYWYPKPRAADGRSEDRSINIRIGSADPAKDVDKIMADWTAECGCVKARCSDPWRLDTNLAPLRDGRAPRIWRYVRGAQTLTMTAAVVEGTLVEVWRWGNDAWQLTDSTNELTTMWLSAADRVQGGRLGKPSGNLLTPIPASALLTPAVPDGHATWRVDTPVPEGAVIAVPADDRINNCSDDLLVDRFPMYNHGAKPKGLRFLAIGATENPRSEPSSSSLAAVTLFAEKQRPTFLQREVAWITSCQRQPAPPVPPACGDEPGGYLHRTADAVIGGATFVSYEVRMLRDHLIAKGPGRGCTVTIRTVRVAAIRGLIVVGSVDLGDDVDKDQREIDGRLAETVHNILAT